MGCIRVTGDFLFLNVRVVPGASKSGIVEVKDDKLKIRIAAVPEDGKANEELRLFLANALEFPKKDIVITSGEKSRIKILRLPILAKKKLDGICKMVT
ncbi:MAG: DUF167 domain-containing protein [Treponema sp.]|nr:DUF167 domain-containing protein [Treponema sp.]